jgi:hypothetical protein
MRSFRIVLVVLMALTALRPAVGQSGAASILQPTPVPEVVLTQNTPVSLKLAQNISNKTDTVGDKIELMLDQDITVNGVVLGHKGARALGKITEGKKDEGREMGKSLKFELLYFKAGSVRVPLTGQIAGEGHHNTGAVVAATVILGVPGLVAALNSPKTIVIPEGTPLVGYVAEDTRIPVPPEAPQAAVARP